MAARLAVNTISVTKGKSPRFKQVGLRHSKFKSDDRVLVKDNGYRLEFDKAHIDQPGSLKICGKSRHVQIISDIPIGRHEIVENEEDYLIIEY